MECLYLKCGREPTLRVSGGRLPVERVGGWSGAYCELHAIRVVRHQIFQATAGMPIKIEKL
jgi:hypothetical protein